MAESHDLLLGEFPRTLDERFRLSIPAELADPLAAQGSEYALVKERPGCLSLWNADTWRQQVDPGLEVVKSKLNARRLDGRYEDMQRLGRMLSTRHKLTPLAGRGRLVIPDGFRQFLGVEAGGEVIVVGAAVCVEVWRPATWMSYLEEQIPAFGQLLNQLSN